jgi:branched-chain amino acid aminotransferase
MTTMSPSTEITFDMRVSDHPMPDDERAAILAAPTFGMVFSDHMITLRWAPGRGWHDGRLEPYGPFTLEPGTQVFHYGQEIFEGLKAYRQAGENIAAFRPQANAARFNTSARRLAMPELPEDTFVQAIELLVSQDRECLFCLIASPAGAYFASGVKPVSVWLSQEYTRAAPGGTGEAKCGGNYAASFAGQQQAVASGCDQVVWLDAAERRWVEEMGGMNLFFVHGSGPSARITTPPLSGSLLPGITRDSLLTLAPELGIKAEEARISVEEWEAGCASGDITEVFACGTAAVITPVGKVKSPAGEWLIGDGGSGPVTLRLREELTGLQYGDRPDTHGWLHKIC